MADEFSFSYQPGLTRDLDKVRFYSSDTDENGFYVPDATITALLAELSDWHIVTLEILRYIISQLSQPDFHADWLSVSNASALQGFQDLLALRMRQFGVGAGRPIASSHHSYRADSRQTSAPDYSDYGAPPDELATGRGGF